MIRRITTIAAAVIAAAAMPARFSGQEPAAQDSPTYKMDVNVVNVLLNVRDWDGRVVSTLTKEDFDIEENGRTQEIQYFSRQSDMPLTLGLLVDTSLSQRRLIEEERDASYKFFNQVLRPEKDLAFVIKFDVEVELLRDLTNSRRELEIALAQLRTPGTLRPRRDDFAQRDASHQWAQLPFPVPGTRRPQDGQRGPGGQRPQSGQGRRAVGTALYDAVFLASDELLRKQAGRKAIILISDGVDQGSRMSEASAIEAAQRADAIIYGIHYYDSAAYQAMGGRGGFGRGPGTDGGKVLERLSEQTGGRMFRAKDDEKLDQIFTAIQEELRNQYMLGYAAGDLSDRGFRRITVRTRDRRLRVQTREGYYPKGG